MVGMQNFQGTFETCKQSFISAFLICMTVPLNPVLVLLLVNFVSGLRLKLMYISLIISIRSHLTHLHGFQQLVLLP